jgi:hypothetical protein
MFKGIVCAVLLAAFAASGAQAAGPTEFNKHFGDMDKNSDGYVDQAEWSKAFPKDADEFAKADGNKDGKVNHDEWHSFKKGKGIKDSHQ